jgi:hypothetical protein
MGRILIKKRLLRLSMPIFLSSKDTFSTILCILRKEIETSSGSMVNIRE